MKGTINYVPETETGPHEARLGTAASIAPDLAAGGWDKASKSGAPSQQGQGLAIWELLTIGHTPLGN